MNIHEYQAKSLLTKFGVAVPKGGIAYTPQEAETVAKSLAGPVYVVKSQIHAGGRGAGKFKGDEQGKGGVRLVKSPADAAKEAQAMLGHVLVTKQTGPKGREVKRIYVEDGCDIKRELYLGMLIDRKTSRVTVMASTEGGMEIEEVAAKTPEKILKIAIDPATGMEGFHARRLAYALKLEGKQVSAAVKFMLGMYKALVRHPDIEAMRDEAEEDPIELEAGKHSLNYVKLDGNIGCMVNGAGLAMATMDIIKLYGGEPANFLDVGGGATKERVATA